jgi:hypothetical protein
MGFLKFLVWTGCAVGLGVFLANADINGRSTLEYVQRQWKHYVQPAKVDRQVDRQVERVKDGLREAIDEAKGAVNRTTKQTPAAPRERITNEDRAAIDRIIAQKK